MPFSNRCPALTTTGSTVLVKLDELPRGILLWRSILQGLGGLGIVVTALIMLPFLRVGGMQLFQMESSDRSEKVLPRALELVTATAAIYGGLMVACIAAYLAFGMTPFDAICHALTTVATAGFSTHDKSFGFFQSPALQWVCIVFMILGALPFVVFIRMLRGEPAALWRGRPGAWLCALSGDDLHHRQSLAQCRTRSAAERSLQNRDVQHHVDRDDHRVFVRRLYELGIVCRRTVLFVDVCRRLLRFDLWRQSRSIVCRLRAC